MIEALIFDCDGTLTDSMPLHYRAWREVLDPPGIPFSEDTFYSLAGMPGHKVIAAVAEQRFSETEIADIVARRETAFLGILHEIEPVRAVVEIANSNRSKLKMGVASGSLRFSVERQLSVLGIAEWFSAIVAAEDTERHKPEPDVFLEAARRLDVPPAHCRVYEDSDLGIEAAKRAGMQWVDVRPLYAKDA